VLMETAMEASSSSYSQAPPPAPENPEGSGAGEEAAPEEEEEDEGLISQAQKFMEMITSSPDNPSPKALHALASVLEKQEARYLCVFLSLSL